MTATLPARDTTRYGWHRDLPDHRDHTYQVEREQINSLPSRVDLRAQCPAVYDQGQIGSCTANAIGAAFEFDLLRQKLTDFTPSRLFIYWNERSIEGTTASDSGAQIRDGVKVVATLGVPDETVWPYDDTAADSDGTFPSWARAGQAPPPEVFAAAKHNEAVKYQRVVQDLNHLRAALAAGTPVVFGFTVYESFESHQVARTGDAPMPKPDDQALGGHAVLLVGYDDAKHRFIVRNSWGTGWGQDGYFTLPYAYVRDPHLTSDFWTITTVS
jgi:C1A family cysteine protease